jgi:hypothetical protein
MFQRERHQFDEWTSNVSMMEMLKFMLGELGCAWCFIPVTQRVGLSLIRLSDEVRSYRDIAILIANARSDSCVTMERPDGRRFLGLVTDTSG